MSHEFTIDKSKMGKMNFAIHLMEGLPIAETTEGYDYEDWRESMDIIQLNIRRAQKVPEKIEKCYQMVMSELRHYDIGCLTCAYRDYIEEIEAHEL